MTSDSRSGAERRFILQQHIGSCAARRASAPWSAGGRGRADVGILEEPQFELGAQDAGDGAVDDRGRNAAVQEGRREQRSGRRRSGRSRRGRR